MLKLAFLGVTGFTFLLTFWQREATAPVATQQPASLLQCSPLESFNEHVQARFLKAEQSFGMARMTPRTHFQNFQVPLVKFLPRENEWPTVNELGKSGWQVVFYLAGRQVLGDKAKIKSWEVSPPDPTPLAPIKGPLEITGDLSIEDLPTAESLWSQSQQAMKRLAQHERDAFTIGKWNFSARPIRARAECLKCHVNDSTTKDPFQEVTHEQTIKTGDVLGVALYAYRLSNQPNK